MDNLKDSPNKNNSFSLTKSNLKLMFLMFLRLETIQKFKVPEYS